MMQSQPQDISKTIRCDNALLLQSLDERLSEPQEALLAQHLTQCDA